MERKDDPSRELKCVSGGMLVDGRGDRDGLLQIVGGGDWPRDVESGGRAYDSHHCNKPAPAHIADRRKRAHRNQARDKSLAYKQRDTLDAHLAQCRMDNRNRR